MSPGSWRIGGGISIKEDYTKTARYKCESGVNCGCDRIGGRSQGCEGDVVQQSKRDEEPDSGARKGKKPETQVGDQVATNV